MTSLATRMPKVQYKLSIIFVIQILTTTLLLLLLLLLLINTFQE